MKDVSSGFLVFVVLGAGVGGMPLAVCVPERALEALRGFLNLALALGGFQGGREVNFATDASAGFPQVPFRSLPFGVQNRFKIAPKSH